MKNKKMKILGLAFAFIIVGGLFSQRNNPESGANPSQVSASQDKKEVMNVIGGFTSGVKKTQLNPEAKLESRSYSRISSLLPLFLKDYKKFITSEFTEQEAQSLKKMDMPLENIIESLTGENCNYTKDEVPSKRSFDISNEIRQAYLVDQETAESQFLNYLTENSNEKLCATNEPKNQVTLVKFKETLDGKIFIEDVTSVLSSATKEEIREMELELQKEFTDSGSQEDVVVADIAFQKIAIFNEIKEKIGSRDVH